MAFENIRKEIAQQFARMDEFDQRIDEIVAKRADELASIPNAKAMFQSNLIMERNALKATERKLDNIENQKHKFVDVTECELGNNCLNIIAQPGMNIESVHAKLAKLDVWEKLGHIAKADIVLVSFVKIPTVDQSLIGNVAAEFVSQVFVSFEDANDAMLYRLAIQ